MSSILSSAEGGIVAVAVGEGAAAAVEPIVEPAKQEVWRNNPYRVLDPGLLAELVAQALVAFDDAQPQAQRSGYDGNKFRAMVEATLRAPGTAETLELWRRERITEEQARHALHKAGLEEQWIAPVLELFTERLSPQEVALGIMRSIIADPGLLPVDLNTDGGVVPRYPQSAIDPLKEAQTGGFDRERLRVLVGEIGLPMSPQEAASALFRRIIERPDFNRAIVEGDTRPEWADAILAQARQILTAGQYAELQLRGFLTATEREQATAKHGMSPEDSQLLYDLLGRSINVHQIVTGLARGGEWTGSATSAPEPYLSALRRGNLRPEYYSLAYANRYTLPSAFVIRALLRDGAIGADRGRTLLEESGWPPELATLVADHYATTTGATADPHVGRAQTQLWTTTHRTFIANEIDEATARAQLGALGIGATAQDEIIALWDAEKSLVRKQLTAAQIKKAWTKVATNAATGAPWTRDEAVAALVARGYSVTEANDFLNI